MKKGILLIVAMTLFFFVANAQTVVIDIQESDGGCGQGSDCEANIACFDMLITINQANWALTSYNVWTQYPEPPTMSYFSDNACLSNNGGDTDDNPNGQYRVGGVDGEFVLPVNTPTIFHSICYSYSDELEIRDSIIASGGTLLIYGTPFSTTVTLINNMTGQTVGLVVPQQDFLTLDGSTFTCLDPDISILKELTSNADNDNSNTISVGDVLTYTVTATNTGSIPETNVEVSDPMLVPSSAYCASLDPAETCILVGTYTVTQADVDSGKIVNTGTVVSDNTGPTVSQVDTPVPNTPGIDIVKTLLTDVSDTILSGDVLNYSVKVENTGNITLHNLVVSDPKLAPNSITCPSVPIGGFCTLSGFYMVTQADVNTGEIVNTATANSNETIEDTAQVTTPIPQNPVFSIEKSLISDVSEGIEVGDFLLYQIEGTNSGNLTLHNLTISDPLLTPGFKSRATLVPDGVFSLTGYYIVKQSDVDAGQIVNTATGDSDETGPETSQVTTLITQNLETETVKNLLTDISGGVAEGDVLEYQVVVTNTGNTTLHNVSVSDAILTPDVANCDSLTPGEACTLTGTYTLSQIDVDAGEIENIGIGDSDETLPDPDTLNTPLLQNPTLLVEKSTSDSTYFEIGQTIHYSIDVTNMGNVTISNITIVDLEADPGSISCSATELLPGESLTCTAIHTIDQDDMFAGEVINIATANGDDPLGNPVSQTSNEVVVSIQIIIANDDTGTPVNGFDGGVAVPNVLVNDLLSALPVDPADITLTEVSSTNPGVSLDLLTGAVNVAPGTPAGNYELVYEICEVLNPTNCDQATVTLTVTAPEIIANDDNGTPVNGMNGGISVPDVLVNDLLNGLPVDPADITLTEVSSTNPGVILDPLTGAVNVAPGTPAGNYELIYEICDNINLTNCDQATVFVEVTLSSIIANNDFGTPVNGMDGGVSVPDVLVNDLLNGLPVDIADITLVEISSTHPGVSLNPLTGAVTVAPGTPAGDYELVYEICENLNPTNCDQATAFVPVIVPEILANDDTGTPVNGFEGGEAVPNVLVNDLLNDDPVDPIDITLTEVSSDDPGVSLNPLTGAVNVAPGTPAGVYELVYEICEILNPINCDEATVTVTVEAPEILANDDTGTLVNGFEGGVSFANVLVSDLLNGDPVDANDITLTVISSTNPGVSLDPLTGAVNVAPGTPAGNYELVYEICEILNPTNCDQATVTVPVDAPEIIANDDTGTPVIGFVGGISVPDVLVNDLLNGLLVDIADITITEISSTNPGVSLDLLTGAVNVAPGTPAGNYELVYEICENLNPTNCDEATVTVTVEAPEIIANDDTGTSINGYAGGEAVPDVLVNDLLNGLLVDIADITITEISSTNPGVSLDLLTGAVNVAPGTPAGNYELVYEICENLNPTNCDEATVTVTVEAPEIIANDDTGTPLNGIAGGVSVPDVLVNDLLNGDPIDPNDITLTEVSSTNPGVSLNPLTGEVNVAPGTPAGTYELVYEICEIVNLTNCDQATVFVEVTLSSIIAIDDFGTDINGVNGGVSVPDVLVNDLLNGLPVDIADITIAEISSTHTGVSLNPLTGAVNVAPGTPAGNYELVYEICENLNPTNCDQATAFVPVIVPEILANDDTGTPVNGFEGGEAVPNVLVNDLLNGDPVDPNDITLTEVSSDDPGVSLNPLTGAVNVAPGTPAGIYELVYEICEILNPANCDEATVTVTVEAPEILANDDSGTLVNGFEGGVSFANVLVNDLLNGDPVDPNDITLTQISSTNLGVSLDPLTGEVNVAPGTPAGIYELVYEICEIVNPTNCDQAAVTVPVEAPEILANDDAGTPVNGLEGGVSFANVLVNDELNGLPVDPADIALVEISTTNPGVSLDLLTGAVNVAPGTPAGNYELVYEICEILNPTNCDEATVTVPVVTPEILANDDAGTPVNGLDGGEAVPNVLVNDLLNGDPVDSNDITLTEVSSDDPGISLDPLTGAVNVAPGTPAGIYELVYEICEILNPTNCDEATVTVTVEAPEIIANDDTGTSINGYAGGEAVPDVLVNDLLNGDPIDPNDITLTEISSTNPGVSLDPLTGAVNVAPGTSAGNYELVYEICEILNPTNCDQATAFVEVTFSSIVANDDFGVAINGLDGGVSFVNVLVNDELGGVSVLPAEITLTQISSTNPGVSLDPLTGAVNVAPGTPAGNYELVYEICENLNPTNCDQATVFVPVIAPEILANDDTGTPVNGFVGGEAVPNVLVNDLLNGDPVDPNDITLTEVSSDDPGVSLDPLTGAVNVAPGTPAGVYELVYEICEILNPANCDEATVTVTVEAPEILANDDFGTLVNGFEGGVSFANVLVDDLLNGDPVDANDITLTQISSTNPGVSLDPLTGEVNVAPGTPAGNYELVYEICEILNPTNCDQAAVTVPVEAPEILANDDAGTPVNGLEGGVSYANVLVNDLLNGDPVDANDITLTEVSSTNPGVSLNPLTGAVNVATGTPAGNYELVYEICEILNPSNCDQATVTVPVTAPEILANDDAGTPVNGLDGGEAVPNVLVNDLLNGDPIDPNDITLTEISSTNPGVSLDPLTGAVNVAPGTPAGNYELVYEICEILNPTNCDEATVTVIVEAPEIIANDDIGTSINGYAGGEAVPNVLVNDLLNGDPIDPNDITLTEISSTNPGVSLNPLTGAVNVAPGTPAGNYELVYEICENLNPTNCDQATVFVEVTFSSIVANDDFGIAINGLDGGVSFVNVFVNDELGGVPVIPGEITLAQISTTNPGVSLNPLTGVVTVAPGTPAGNYELVYEICENLNPTNCDQATVFVPVTAPEILANDDAGIPVNGFEGGEAVPNVLVNDLLNGDPVDPNDITLTEVSSDDPGVSLDPLTGAVNVAPGTPAGIYELVYEICEILNPANCDEATVTVTVEAPEIIANDNTGTPVNGFEGGVSFANVLVNDLLNGDPVDPNDITLTQISSTNLGVSLDPLTGAVNVPPGTPAGNYELVYEICEIVNPTNCDQAIVFVPVTAPEIIANNDTGTPVNGFDGGEAVPNVLVNDELNGLPVDLADISLTEISTTNPGVSLDPLSGAVNVAPGTPAGNYELVYEICEIVNPGNCDQAVVTVTVEAPEIIANDDSGGPINGYVGGVAVADVLVNDLLNGDPVDLAEITLIDISSEDPGVILNTVTGEVIVIPGTPAGTYQLVYKICEIVNPDNCDLATVTVVVVTADIIANNDTGTPLNGFAGGVSVPDVLVNDLLNGLPFDPADITLEEISSTNPGVSLDPLTGAVNVAPGTPAGNYELVYEICENLNPANCDQATVFVEVTFSSILANDDFGIAVNGLNGGVSVLDILVNDELNGLPVELAEITITEISSTNPGVSLNPLTGVVNVAPGTPAGNYELVYEICENLNPTNCDQATVTIPVEAPEIVANDDTGIPVNGFVGGGSVPDVLVNDLLNGLPFDPADITMTEISSTNPGVSLNPLTGVVTVAPGTPAGNYELVYEICENLNPTNCDQATVFVPVTAPEIIANDDNGTPVNGFDGGISFTDVLVNDLLNGLPFDPAEITLAEISTTNPGVSLNPLTGAVNVAPGTPAGNYELVYEICENLNPTNCDQATAFVPVTAPEILANDDTGIPVNGAVGGISFTNVLANDLLNGLPFDPADITLAEISTTNPGVSLDPLNGAVNVAPGTPAGNYELVYEICEIINPDNCDQATVTVPVFEKPSGGFCFNNVIAETGVLSLFCSTEPIAFTFCDIFTGEAPFTICWELDGVPDCETIVYVGDTLFIQTLDPETYHVEITSITDILGNVATDLTPYDFNIEVVTGSVANAGIDATICEGVNYQLGTATASNYSSLQWQGGQDGFFFLSNTALNPMYIPSAVDIENGFVDLCLTAFPEDPCTTPFVDCMKLTIRANAVANAGVDISVCETDGYVELNGIVTDGNPAWAEAIFTGGFFEDANLASTKYFFSVDDILLGTIELCLTAIPNSPCFIPNEDCLNVTITKSPLVNAGVDKSVCEGESILLDDASAVNVESIVWTTNGDGIFDDDSIVSPIYYPGEDDIASGSAQLCLIGYPMGGCLDFSINCLNLNILNAPSASISPDQELVCADYDVDNGAWLPLDFNNSITGDYISIEWTTDGDGTFSNPNAENPEYYLGVSDIWDGDLEICINIQAAGNCQFNVTECITIYVPQQLIYFDEDKWWGISSYLETDLPTVPEVMDPLVLIPGSQHLVNMVDKTGQYFWPEPIPPTATLGDWMPIGYKLKIKNSPACLPIYGDSLVDQTFELNGSYTYLPVLTNVPTDIETLFAGHLEDILLIYHWADNSLWTPIASDFTDIYPGYAYLMVNKFGYEPYTITYPDYVPDAPHLYPNQVKKSVEVNNSPWSDVENTALPHILLFAENAVSRLLPGDILGAFNENKQCYGMAEYGNKDAIYKLVAMGNNGFSKDEHGFNVNDEMTFKVYRQSTGEELEVTFIYDTKFPSSDGLFANNGVSMVKDIVISTTSVTEPFTETYQLNVYPNPASVDLNVVSNQIISEIQILNNLGQVVYESNPNVSSTLVDVSKLPKGIYLVAVKSNSEKVTIKRVSIY